MRKIITLTVISTVLLFLSSCIFFQNVNQPAASAPNQIVTVTIIASTQGGGYEPYFGVCLPIGWTVPGDSVQCGGAYEEAIHYDTLVAFNQESVSPAPAGYYWWAGKGIPDETAVGNVFANLKIQTDNQLGDFSIDYMLGDGYYGVNYERSNGHLIEITNNPLILYVNPEKGYQNFSLEMNILGLNTHFSDGTGTDNVWLSKNSDEISANSFVVNSNTSIDANFSIPLTADTGLWDVNVETDIDGIVTKAEGFIVLPSPPIIVVSPDSLVVGVLPGSTKTKILTINNVGEGDLYFDIIGGYSSNNFALLFDGIDDYINVPNINLIYDQLTLEAWVILQDNFEIREVIDNTEQDFQLEIWQDRSIMFDAVGGSSRLVTSSNVMPLNQWVHLAATYDGAIMSIYVDGVLVAEQNFSGSINRPNSIVHIGTETNGLEQFWKGIIDEVRIWKVARTEQEIQQFMHEQLTGIETGLVGYWQFNEGSDTITYDKTINENHGTLYGGVQWTDIVAPMLPGWFQMSTDSGFCSPHSSIDVELLFDATEVDTGDYYASIIVKSNDPFTPSVIVPIHMIVSTSVGVEDGLSTPMVFNLEQNYPNPFNPSTTIKYSIPSTSKVKLTLFNLLGEEVTTLVNEEKVAGNYSVEFNAASLPSGVYFYHLKAGEYVNTKKMILLK